MEWSEDDRNVIPFRILQMVSEIRDFIQKSIILSVFVTTWQNVTYHISTSIIEIFACYEIRHMRAER
ncbi:hypothetical protein D3C86_919690 [compost metagenome]